MLGANPKRKIISGSGETLEVQEIFATIQGEGPNTGTPAIFIRLGGCNLACSFCDTEFESFCEMELDKVIREVKKLSKVRGKRQRNLAVITGGEPLRQPIELLCKKLLNDGFYVQIETNGTIFRELDARVEIICSPKNQGRGYGKIRDDLLKRISALKFLVSASDAKYGEIPEVGQSKYNIPVYIQPMDEADGRKNIKNIKKATTLAQEGAGRLSLQMHKILGIP